MNTNFNIFTDGWAYRSDEEERKTSNKNAYKELVEKFKVFNATNFSINKNILEENNLVYQFVGGGNTYDKYEILKADERLSADEILLLISGGCLCFGGCKCSEAYYNVYTD